MQRPRAALGSFFQPAKDAQRATAVLASLRRHPPAPAPAPRRRPAAPAAPPASAATPSSRPPPAPPQNPAPAVPSPAPAPSRTPHGRRASQAPSPTTGPSAGTASLSANAVAAPKQRMLRRRLTHRRDVTRSPSRPPANSAAAGTHRSAAQPIAIRSARPAPSPNPPQLHGSADTPSAASSVSAPSRSRRCAATTCICERVRQTSGCHRRQHAVRTKLETRPRSLFLEHPHAVQKPHRAAHLAHPVLRAAQLFSRRSTPRHVAHDRQLRPSVARPIRQQPSGTPPASAPFAASGTRGSPASAGAWRPFRAEVRRQRDHRRFIARDHRRARPVQPAQSPPRRTARAAAAPPLRSPRRAIIAPPSGSACINRPRAATTRHASFSDHTPATMRRRELAYGMPQQHVGLDAPLRQLTEQRHLHRKQRRLR